MEVIEPVERMRDACMNLHREGKQIKFVPTMGSLHRGHTSLIERAANDRAAYGGKQEDSAMAGADLSRDNSISNPTKGEKDSVVIVSIFVNPTQFNNVNDFLTYPKSLAEDLEICKQTKLVDYVFVPNCQEIYKNNTSDASIDAKQCCRIAPPANCIAYDLEGKSRPGHFEGMLTVVCKLFHIIQPDRAYFGEKDYQQLLLVSSLVEDLSMRTKICPVETVREQVTNLPLSSRNIRLTQKQRQSGAIMYSILMSAKDSLEQKCSRTFIDSSHGSNLNTDLDMILLSSMLAAQCLEDLDDVGSDVDGTSPVKVDYFELRCAKDLTVIGFNRNLNIYDCQMGCVERNYRIDSGDATDVLKARLLISVIVANIRLLDNLEVKLNL